MTAGTALAGPALAGPATPPPDVDAGQPVGANVLVSRTPDGDPATGSSHGPSMTDDGRYVVFASTAQDLVPGDNGPSDVFLRDRRTGETTLLSTSFDGKPRKGTSYQPSISGDGSFVVFTSVADNLVPDDENSHYDIFGYDVATGELSLVSVNAFGEQSNGNSEKAVLSRDGRFVAFQTSANNLDLDGGDTNGFYNDIYLVDRDTEEAQLVSHRPGGKTGRYVSNSSPTISDDGSLVGYGSFGKKLTRDDVGKHFDAFVWHRDTDTNELVSKSTGGEVGDDHTTSAVVSADGRYVAMASDARNLVPEDTDRRRDIYVRDLQTGVTTLESVTSGGKHRHGDSLATAISDDGSMVLFTSTADLTRSNPPDGVWEAYLRDRVAGTTTLVSAAPDGVPGNGMSDASLQLGEFSADGSLVTYDSSSSNLVPDDDNGLADVFVYRIR